MASVIRGNDNFDSAGGAAMKAWVNFNGTGTVAIRASYNVSSITDNGTGNYTANFTTALADANYSVVTSSNRNNSYTDSQVSGFFNPTTSAVSLAFGGPEGVSSDPVAFCIAVFR